jgi:hypothetical protein
MKITGPRGWRHDQVLHRLTDTAIASMPLSYNAKSRTVDAILSMGPPVKRIYGTEILRIDAQSVDLSRVRAGLAPLLDSHQGGSITNVLGRISSAWFKGGELWGKLLFAETAQGKVAEQMVARRGICSVSLGYQVSAWEIRDADGDVIDPKTTSLSWDDDLQFTATRFAVLEVSLCAIPADGKSLIRSLGSNHHHDIDDIKQRMLSREKMQLRQAMHDRQCETVK